MSVKNLINRLEQQPEAILFDEVMDVINEHYHYTPAKFINGSLQNEAGKNEGSCKVFYFAQLNSLTKEQTLVCFGQYYREDVLKNPHGDDHGNIRNFISNGWAGIKFETAPLTLRSTR